MSKDDRDRAGPPFPLPVRLRTRLVSRLDRAATWFADHGMWRTARRIWKLCGMW